MKKLFVLLILLLSFGRSQAADIEARTGILGGDGWGLQTGAYINFPQSRLFSIQTGLLLHTAGNSFSYGDSLYRSTEYEKKHTRVQKNQYSNHLHMKTNSLRYAATIPFV